MKGMLLLHFHQNWNVLTHLSITAQYKISQNISQVFSSCNAQTKRHEKAMGAFLQLLVANVTKARQTKGTVANDVAQSHSYPCGSSPFHIYHESCQSRQS